MTPLGHTGISLITAIAASKILPIDPWLTISAITIGGLAPDLDLLPRLIIKNVKFFEADLGNHRFFPSHTPFIFILIFLFFVLISKNTWGGLFTLGAMIHFFLDTLFVREGIALLYPFSQKRFSFLTINTHRFWAPRPISGVKKWWINYLKSPLFLIMELTPVIIGIVLIWIQIQ